jgi:hypothetical protein
MRMESLKTLVIRQIANDSSVLGLGVAILVACPQAERASMMPQLGGHEFKAVGVPQRSRWNQPLPATKIPLEKVMACLDTICPRCRFIPRPTSFGI